MGFALRKPEGEPGASWPAIVIGLFVAFGGVLYGFDTVCLYETTLTIHPYSCIIALGNHQWDPGYAIFHTIVRNWR